MVFVDYCQTSTCATTTSSYERSTNEATRCNTYSTVASSYDSSTNVTSSSHIDSKRCYASTYAVSNDVVDSEEETIKIRQNKITRLLLEIKPKVQILDNKPLRRRQLLFSKSGWLLPKGKLKRRGY
jgi:hypothetical protein